MAQLCLRDQWTLWCSSIHLLIEQHPQNKAAHLVSTIWFPDVSCVSLVIGESRLAEEHTEFKPQQPSGRFSPRLVSPNWFFLVRKRKC